MFLHNTISDVVSLVSFCGGKKISALELDGLYFVSATFHLLNMAKLWLASPSAGRVDGKQPLLCI